MSPDIATALRSQTPSAPYDLRERVAAIAATAPASPKFTPRRVLQIAIPAVAGLSLAAALAVGLSSAIKGPGEQLRSAGGATAEADQNLELRPAVTREAATDFAAPPLPDDPRALKLSTPTPSAGGRAQDVRSSMTLLVDGTGDLSATTQRALRIARRLGGYVVSVQYATPKPGEGTAAVTLRIPVTRVQAAVVQLNGLGEILSQQTRITDVQQRLDDLTRQLRNAKGDKSRIAALRRQRTAIRRQAAFATLDVNLTTHAPTKPKAAPGRLENAIDDATGILAAELAIGAYALIVASPLLLLLVAAFFGNRTYRRHADQRLLERA